MQPWPCSLTVPRTLGHISHPLLRLLRRYFGLPCRMMWIVPDSVNSSLFVRADPCKIYQNVQTKCELQRERSLNPVCTCLFYQACKVHDIVWKHRWLTAWGSSSLSGYKSTATRTLEPVSLSHCIGRPPATNGHSFKQFVGISTVVFVVRYHCIVKPAVIHEHFSPQFELALQNRCDFSIHLLQSELYSNCPPT